MAWQGHIRAISSDYDRVVVAGPKGHEAMYSYVDRYIPLDVDTVRANMWMNDTFDGDALETFRAEVGCDDSAAVGEWLTPSILWNRNRKGKKEKFVTALKPQTFARFGDNGVSGYDILYHARLRNDWDSGFRNWTVEHCTETLSSFSHLKVGSIGRSGRALHIPGTDDLRDVSLRKLADLMANSRCLVGPVSGPVHFGVLVGIPQLTWATKDEHRERTTIKWNPFNSPINCITADDSVWVNRIPWCPSVKDVVGGIGKILDG